MNMYFAAGFAILIALACAASGYEGNRIGKDTQAVADQSQFDKYNQQIASQKVQAAAILADANAANAKLAADRDTLKTQLGAAHAAAEIATNSLRTQLAGSSLRFAAGEDSGCGAGGSGTKAAGASADSSAASAVIQLPAKVTSDLRQLAFDADELKNNYAACLADDQVK